MSEERETEIVAGVIEGVTQKRPDTWQVGVKPDGSQYTKNLWTKDAELVSALTEKLGQHGAFVCSASYWENKSGQQVRSLWINSVGEAEAAAASSDVSEPAARTARVSSPQDGMTPEKWDAKERRDYRSRAWAQTISAFQHTIKLEEDPKDVFLRLQPFQRKVYEDICGMFSYPADDSDIPFA